MNKKSCGYIFLILTLIFPFFILPVKTVFGEDLSGPQGVSMQCLAVTRAGDHTVSLSTKADKPFIPADSTVYIVECFSTDDGKSTCTTGKKEADALLGLEGPLAGYTVEHNVNQPVKSDLNGRLTGEPFTWKSVGPEAEHTYWGFLISKNIDLSTGAPVLKLGTWYPQNADTDCLSLRWDPMGMVFDSKSLEPIPNAVVYLYDQNNLLVNQMGVKNPDMTKINGKYSFIVEEGYYSLKPVLTTHKFPASGPISFINDVDFPYNNIYKGSNFYEPAGIVVEKNIPVDPIGSPYRREALITDWATELIKYNNQYKIHGGAIHPFSKITVLNKGLQISNTVASKTGRFEFYLDGARVDDTAPIILAAAKPDIMKRTESLSLFSSVFAQNKSADYAIDPILNYIEGYIVNPSTGRIASNAKVGIYLTVSKNPFYETKTDNNGFVKIASQYLPPMPYNLKIQTAEGESFTLATNQFVKGNETYQTEKKIDYGAFRPERNLLTPSPEEGPTSGFLPAATSSVSYLTASPTGSMTPGYITPPGNFQSTENLISRLLIDNNGQYKPFSLLALILLIVIFLSITAAGIYLLLRKKINEENKQKSAKK